MKTSFTSVWSWHETQVLLTLPLIRIKSWTKFDSISFCVELIICVTELFHSTVHWEDAATTHENPAVKHEPPSPLAPISFARRRHCFEFFLPLVQTQEKRTCWPCCVQNRAKEITAILLRRRRGHAWTIHGCRSSLSLSWPWRHHFNPFLDRIYNRLKYLKCWYLLNYCLLEPAWTCKPSWNPCDVMWHQRSDQFTMSTSTKSGMVRGKTCTQAGWLSAGRGV